MRRFAVLNDAGVLGKKAAGSEGMSDAKAGRSMARRMDIPLHTIEETEAKKEAPRCPVTP
tara:strand:+ start:2411 stop:2590 length:180 start_codon:yes stop_codon:yes gene_type:complete